MGQEKGLNETSLGSMQWDMEEDAIRQDRVGQEELQLVRLPDMAGSSFCDDGGTPPPPPHGGDTAEGSPPALLTLAPGRSAEL